MTDRYIKKTLVLLYCWRPLSVIFSSKVFVQVSVRLILIELIQHKCSDDLFMISWVRLPQFETVCNIITPRRGTVTVEINEISKSTWRFRATRIRKSRNLTVKKNNQSNETGIGQVRALYGTGRARGGAPFENRICD